MSIEQGYKQTDIGEIPEGWGVARLGTVSEIVGGSTPSTSEPTYWNGNIPFVTPSDVTALNGKNGLSTTERTITKKGLENTSAILLPEGSILLTSRATIGVCAINNVKVVTNQGLANLIPKEGIDRLWLLYQLRFQRNELKRLACGSTFREVSKSSLRRMKIPLPSVLEQRKIASILSTVDEAIQKTDEVIQKTEMLKRGFMQRLLTRGIGHKEFKQTGLGEIPKTWDVIKIGDLIVDHKAGIYKKREFYGSGYNIVGVADLYYHDAIDGQIFRLVELTPEEYDEYSLEEGDLIYGESSLVYEGIGKALVVTSKGERTAFAWHTRRLKVDKTRVNPYFLHHALNASYVRKSIMKRATRTAITGITVDEFFKTRVPLPNKTEQTKIAEIISSIDKRISLEKTRKMNLEELKKGLMQVLLTGKVRVKVD